MSETKELLRRGIGGFEPMPDAYERVIARRDHKRRNQRVAAGILGIAVFALAAIGFVRLLGSDRETVVTPATSPTPSPSPVTEPPFTERFVSPLNGLSIGYPSGWQARAATEPWDHDEVTFDAPDVDVFFDPKLKDDLYLAVVSEPLGRKTAWEWYSTGDLPWSVGLCDGGGGGGGNDTVHGIYGEFLNCGEPHGAGGSLVIFATAKRGYMIYLFVGDERAQRRLPETRGDWIEAVLKTVVLPEDALTDWPISSESP